MHPFSQRNLQFFRNYAPYLLTAVLALLIMTPRLIRPYFGLLDDGITLVTVKAIVQQWLTGEYVQHWELFEMGKTHGRFLPVQWFYLTACYLIWGVNAFGWYLMQLLSLIISTSLLMWGVKQASDDNLTGLLSGLFFLFSAPIVESYYTLSKQEDKLVLCLAFSLALLYGAAASEDQKKRWFLIASSILALFFAFLTKETAVIMVPISALWLGNVWLQQKSKKISSWAVKVKGVYFVGSLISCAIVIWLRRLFGIGFVSGGNYAANYRLDWEVIQTGSLNTLHLFIRDYAYILPILLLVILWLFYDYRYSGGYGIHRLGYFAFDVLIWIAGWAAILVPWPADFRYYYLPVAFGVATISGVGLSLAIRLLRRSGFQQPPPAWLKSLALLCIVLTSGALIVTLGNLQTDARVQTTVDAKNAAFIDYLVGNTSLNGHVWINFMENEYFVETKLHTQTLKQRPDVHFHTMNPYEALDLQDFLLANLKLRNAPVPSVRIGMDNNTAALLNRAVFLFPQTSGAPLFQDIGAAPLTVVSLDQNLCRLTQIPICSLIKPTNFEPMVYGWEIYHIHRSSNTTVGIFRPDDGTWHLRNVYTPDAPEITVTFGAKGDIPLTGDWDGDSQDGIGFFRPSELKWELDNNLDGIADIEFVLEGMQSTDLPVTGDWNGDGIDTPGFYRPSDTSWHGRNSNSSGSIENEPIIFGLPDAIPLVGDWNGDGIDTIGCYRPSTGEVVLKNTNRSGNVGDVRDRDYYFGLEPESVLLAGHWTGNTPDTIATFHEGKWDIVRFMNYNDKPYSPYSFGQPGDIPVAGDWDGL